ncbi:MAG: ester cyclase [Candidatus Promineifilaceae bacterium]
MSEQNKMIARRAFEEVLSRGNVALTDELVTADFIGHTTLNDDIIHGPEALKQSVSVLREAFPNYQVTVEDQIAEGDKVVTRWTARGTHQGQFQGVPPTGRQMTMTEITIHRIANGRLAESWTRADILGMMQQLGLVLSPSAASK